MQDVDTPPANFEASMKLVPRPLIDSFVLIRFHVIREARLGSRGLKYLGSPLLSIMSCQHWMTDCRVRFQPHRNASILGRSKQFSQNMGLSERTDADLKRKEEGESLQWTDFGLLRQFRSVQNKSRLTCLHVGAKTVPKDLRIRSRKKYNNPSDSP